MIGDPVAIAKAITPIEAQRSQVMAPNSVTFQTVGDALLAIDPSSDSVYPSQNANRVINLGVEAEPTEELFDQIAVRYKAAKVKRYFVYLSPSPHAAMLHEWLTARRFKVRNELDLLIGTTETLPKAETSLTSRRITPEEANRLQAITFTTDLWPPERFRELLMLTARPEFDLFLAFDSEIPVATGLLCVDSGLGYLGMAVTLPEYRGQGAQSALITARMRRAAERGCHNVYSETYKTILAGSYRNLKRAGFVDAYARPIYVRAT